MDTPIERARSLRKRLTQQEVKVWVRLRALRPLGFHFRRQAPCGPYIVDFACLKHALVVEIDGGHHYTQPVGARDIARDAFLNSDGLRVLRISNADVDRYLNGVIETIVAAAPNPHPARKCAPPSSERGGIRKDHLSPSRESGGPKGRRMGLAR